MTSKLARATFRAHRPAFAGTAVAAFFAATVVSTATTLLVATSADGLSATARRTLAEHGVGSTAAVLLIGSVYMSIFVVASTMSTAVAQQQRELALARAVGARAGQIRRTVTRQAVGTAVPAALAGCASGGVVGRWWFDAMVAHGLVPQEVRFSFSWSALPVCLAVAVVTSCLAAFVASLRFSLLRPARALDEAASGRRGLGWTRTVLGLIATAGAVLLALLLSRQPADEAGEGAFLVLILFCVGAGLLGPRLMGPAAWVVSAFVGRFGGSARLAMLNIRSQPRRFSAAVVPLVLVVGFGLTKIGMHTTAQHWTGSAGSRGEVWMDYAGTSLYAGFAAIAAANTLAMISFERRRDVALLRVVGTLRGQVRAMAVWEAVVVAGTALLVGGAISLVTMAPILDTAFGSPVPHIPWQVVAAVCAGTLLLAGLATGLPVHSVLRRRAIQVVQAA
ncbi:outer membrane-specific lipoprotein transporter subunit LolE [Streptomyces sp. YIM 130001]|uniref:FtsX-like permease family protein n=1 Tax=Streptomyces sp. YIM 130001 TaxID=2259644 RepID=UPI000E65C8FD|nr:FtsX-like permease family protein [Streptomyces sp. YIM 130001]RII18908.1 outer membrane-specific lipoprotein transporter subunit LolE [Streptomyces sp. YIM 130001]